MDTIREKINKQIVSILSTIIPANGYNTSIGSTVIRGRTDATISELPCTLVFPGTESVEKIYSGNRVTMQLSLASLLQYKTHNPSIEAEKALGDIIAALTSQRIWLSFTDGIKIPTIGKHLCCQHSFACGVLERIDHQAGHWENDDATGGFQLRLLNDDFDSGSILNEGRETIAQTTGEMQKIDLLTWTDPTVSNDNYADEINYVDSNVDIFPDPGENTVKISARFIITYTTLVGNPYYQGELHYDA